MGGQAVSDQSESRPHDDLEYMSGGRRFETSCSILRSTSKYLNSPMIREVLCNEALRTSGPDVIATSLIPEFNEAFEAVLDHAEVARLFREERARLPGLAAWLDARHTGDITLDRVKDCPPGTLGHGVKGLLEQGFQLYFGRLGPAASDWEYLRKRRGQTHDIEHIITGFPGTALAGEIALFVANITSIHNFFGPALAKEIAMQSAYLLSTWTLRASLHFPEAMPAVCDGMEKGSILGKRLKRPLWMERWEDYLDWPVTKIRAEFNLPEPEGFVGDWSWVEPQEAPGAPPARPLAAE
jgi:ubiquinone biosynthesis protein COQ4